MDALLGLVRWYAAGAEGEPEGWFRHARTGRRVSRSPDERDEDGNRVGAVGVVYVRW